MAVELTLELLNRFFNELIKDQDKVELKDQGLATLASVFDPCSDFWHVDGSFLWRIKAWRTSEAQRKLQREALELYKAQLDARKKGLADLTKAIQNKMLVEHNLAQNLALKILQNKSAVAANVFGMDLSLIPELPVKHIVMEEGGNYYEL